MKINRSFIIKSGRLICWLTFIFMLIVQQHSFGASADTAGTKKKTFREYLAPGKLDYLTTYKDRYISTNAFIWTQAIKAGFGTSYNGVEPTSHYGGGFFRPLVFTGYKGDLIIGYNYKMDKPNLYFYDLQAEHRLPFGLGYGGGVVKQVFQGHPVEIDYWGKLSYRFKLKNKLSFIVTGQAMQYMDTIRPGGYLAVYHPAFMLTGGYDFEQWRTCLAVMSPKEGAKYRPVVEALFVDNLVGNDKGARFLFANATLGFDGGFLSNVARLGRAMGPTGLEFGNPLGYIFNPRTPPNSPSAPPNNFNRKLNVWEMGRMLNFRMENYALANKNYYGYGQMVVLPFQFDKKKNALDPIFIGGEYLYGYTWANKTMTTQNALVFGYYYNAPDFIVSVGEEYNLDLTQTFTNLGFIYKIK